MFYAYLRVTREPAARLVSEMTFVCPLGCLTLLTHLRVKVRVFKVSVRPISLTGTPTPTIILILGGDFFVTFGGKNMRWGKLSERQVPSLFHCFVSSTVCCLSFSLRFTPL